MRKQQIYRLKISETSIWVWKTSRNLKEKSIILEETKDSNSLDIKCMCTKYHKGHTEMKQTTKNAIETE